MPPQEKVVPVKTRTEGVLVAELNNAAQGEHKKCQRTHFCKDSAFQHRCICFSSQKYKYLQAKIARSKMILQIMKECKTARQPAAR